MKKRTIKNNDKEKLYDSVPKANLSSADCCCPANTCSIVKVGQNKNSITLNENSTTFYYKLLQCLRH
jgi:hypothetical protein